MSQSLKQLWKHSSSLIILGKNAEAAKINNFNYKVLVLERPSKASYPGAFTFPGGVTENSDQVEDWLKFYRKFGIDDSKFKSIIKTCSNRSFIFNHDGGNTISRDISLRITAIRETFEELGVLLCKNKEQLKDSNLFSNLKNNFDVDFWQKQVYKDASNFMRLCEELNVVPDLWSLHEWSCWLTPTFKRQKRFETVFYVVGVTDQPNIQVTNDEVQRSLWLTPKELLDSNKSGENWLPPPQMYESSRLNNEPDIDKVIPFAKERGMNAPTTLIFPMHYHTKDGIIHCYPGDDFYPKNPNLEATEHNLEQYADKTCDECRETAKNLHRLELKSLQNFAIWHNVNLPDNHICPQSKTKPKL
ncbi:nucleoside diphosphate-linked moiety X motif 19-like [Contarinia nasturtii]|uniref:nucleoside diphosphate-linked moiety X motif 19-like n=1 Tax=Contarinia nasturtii TaxID=265458 RepID=UPI0012D41E18|nr:nucleoside diphosphate-linked moiety X motif 19-like [Contarinia nasturtii]